MQLLVIKQGEDYFRFTEDRYERCAMQKASVYPLDAEEKVFKLLAGLIADGVKGAGVYCLKIIEEPYV